MFVPVGGDLYATAGRDMVILGGLHAGDKITCASPSGQILYSGVADGDACKFALQGYKGVTIVKVSGNEHEKTFKLMVK